MTDVSCRVVIDHLRHMRERDLSEAAFFAALAQEILGNAESERAFVLDATNWTRSKTPARA